ncbi:hypothetical protein [Hymenobacter sp. PAMC 26628]|uniref:hypothetical protein n=1 Tax=Hymenobacter sp. PAMC 26628 TaxID=1484118 RepID=UPI00076FFD0F|nr:hypothetical protein [Hymenobacter sp. PAMC 26628]AMJ67760.1 hypothetical protein AXW84_21795 [Hymenobacter sp. PAMC 26628]
MAPFYARTIGFFLAIARRAALDGPKGTLTACFMGHCLRTSTLLVLLLLFAVGAQAQTVPAGQGLVADATELSALRAFYNATGGPNWTTRPGWLKGTTLAEAGNWPGVCVSGGT